MKKTLVIGFGNTLRRDDGLGPRVVEGLQEEIDLDGMGVETVSLPQLDVTLVQDVAHAEVVIFVDARQDESDDQVKVLPVQGSPGPINVQHTSHTISIPDLLAMARDWFEYEPACCIVMPKGYDFSIGDRLSEEALASAEEARRLILDLLQGLGEEVSPPRRRRAARA